MLSIRVFSIFMFRSACDAGLILCALLGIFMFCEPALSLAGTTAQSTFLVSQVVSSELAFVTPVSNLTLSPSLGGLTGGTAIGAVQFEIRSADALGYVVTLAASSSVGMIGLSSSTNSIPAYVPATTGIPDYTFTVPAHKAYFGYSVMATNTPDVVPLFLSNGSSACNTGSNNIYGTCWLNASTTAITILNRTSVTPNSGATSSLDFQVTIQPNPSPVIPDDSYVATTTLTATSN